MPRTEALALVEKRVTHEENCFCDKCIETRVEYLMEYHREREEKEKTKSEIIRKVRWKN